LLGLILTAVSVLVAAGIAVFTGSWLLGLLVLLILLLGSILTCALLFTMIGRWRSKNCWKLSRSIFYLGSSGTCHTFDIKTGFYGVEFMLANHRKIVNATPEVASILRETRLGNYQVPRDSYARGGERLQTTRGDESQPWIRVIFPAGRDLERTAGQEGGSRECSEKRGWAGRSKVI
jgi:hypothetical protein